ncbi:YSIRK-type signal peptide-containing protein [Lactobacillus gallinarum]|jgi:hypothetical protein|uniref:YSIRK Gram-positive signal peptide domain-containing protein n=1 Tax=Lactobacillus gallinarum DSM 10532 = JCM 2011 TaxID=1423748 RepID=A0A0R1NS74_9LACO|nr:YSIRK-type signal peptide-containing protein [Lactobacillus gallinarum]KRL23182.1 hypothetical protein FC37_GL000908 [Lactobacillus gallinarum DSM 10532 = JCM 2011]
MENAADRRQHFAIRKLTVGAASVLLGTTLWLGTNASTAHADVADGNTEPEAHEASDTQADNGTSTAEKVVVEQTKQMIILLLVTTIHHLFQKIQQSNRVIWMRAMIKLLQMIKRIMRQLRLRIIQIRLLQQ